jgi:hypothetical protein
MNNRKDINIIRELAKKVQEIASEDIQEEKRDLWRRHNNLEYVRTPIYIRFGGWEREVIEPLLTCEDSFYRDHEYFLRTMIFQNTLGDDYVIEPWITQQASNILPEKGSWGLGVQLVKSGVEGGSYHVDAPIKELDTVKQMILPTHKIDEEKTAENVSKLKEAVGDILTVNIDRGPFWRMWSGDIATDLGYLRGIEQVMWDIMDNPEWLHNLLGFMRDGILKAHEEAEKAGDWQLCDHQNQSMPYVKGLKDPKANSGPVKRKELWGYMAAQEFTLISPEQHEEFMLQYQIPIMEKFGMTAYGCCEDLTKKIDILRKIPNLRRIAVSPFANVASCAEQIGKDYVCSWRPSPSETVCTGFNEEIIRNIIKSNMDLFKKNHCFADICLKDVHTVQNDPLRLVNFVKIAKSVIEQ